MELLIVLFGIATLIGFGLLGLFWVGLGIWIACILGGAWLSKNL